MKKSHIKNYYIHTSVNSIQILFDIFGLKLNERKTKYRLIFNLIWLGFIGIGEIFWFIDSARSGQMFDNFQSLATATMCILGEVKIIFHAVHENDVIKLIKGLEDLENLTTKGFAKKQIYKKELKYLNILVKVVKILNAVTIFVFALIPVCIMGASYGETNEFVPVLPVTVKYYIFDPYDLKYYTIIYIHQILAMCICLAAFVGVDILFCIICVYIKIHFKLLQHDFERMVPYQNVLTNYFQENPKFKKRFRKLIETHQKVISCADLLEKIHSRVFLYNFLNSSFIICLVGFIVMISKDISNIIPYLSFLATGLQQIFLLCYHGDMVMSSSIDFGESLYICKWYLAKSCIGKDLSFILQRSQKPSKITTCGFMDVNLIAFTKIMSKSLSYLAVLRTLYDN
nr:odorant receptor 22 [Achelura yunnanensis]